MKTVLDAKPWVADPSLVPLPWRDEESFLGEKGRKRLRIAVLWNDAIVKPHPPVVRALEEVVRKLRKVRGVEIVDWKPYKHDFAWELIVSSAFIFFSPSTPDPRCRGLLTYLKASLYYMDGGDQTTDLIGSSGEPWRPLSRFIVSDNPHVKHRTIAEIEDLKLQRDKFRYEYAQRKSPNFTLVLIPIDSSQSGIRPRLV